MKKTISFISFFLVFASIIYGQQKKTIPLLHLAKKNKLQVVGRSVLPLDSGIYKGITLSQDTGEGLVWIKNKSFAAGTIEFDVKGQDVFQQSFVGVAFHGQSDSTYDAVYFRPFNFFAKDSVRHIHAVQYISHPKFTWKKLRDSSATNARYEKQIVNPPDPNGWFHTKVVVKNGTVNVYINKQKTPVLSVTQLSSFKTGSFGLFAGAGSGGSFANLTIE